MNEEIIRKMMELSKDPQYQKGFFDFFVKMQQEGLEAARKFWNQSAEKDKLHPQASEMFEQMASFYSGLGFVPKQKYDAAVKENEELKKENEALRQAIKELNLKVFSEGSAKVQEAWTTVMEKQMALSKEMTKGFVDLFKPPQDKS
jgi:regulator of replication initiation timing